MRDPDYGQHDAGLAWRIPLDRVDVWAREHPERMHRSVHGDKFLNVWRDLWYLWVWVAGGDIDDEVADREWFAVILRDLRSTDYPRLYREAEWELVIERLAMRVSDGPTPPVNGEGLHDQSPYPPILVYQFHGLPEAVVLNVDETPGGPSFALYGIDLMLHGVRPQKETCVVLSRMLNLLRDRDGLHELGIDDETGMIGELEDGELVSRAVGGSSILEGVEL